MSPRLPRLLPLLLTSIVAIAVASPAQDTLSEPLIAALEAGDFEKIIALTEGAKPNSPQESVRAAALQNRGVQRFFDAKIKESIADFDAYLAIRPDEDPHHWQRGISYYYAGEYEKGKAQFERHQTVNSQDVENAVFHFICAARVPGGNAEKARADFIPITADPRVPMKEIWALYAGKGTADEVVKAAQAGDPGEDELRNRLCYAHLYIGLYFEATGDAADSAKHIGLAAKEYKMDHYMGKVAQVHARLRHIGEEKAAESSGGAESRYTTKEPSRDGTGKVYLGRETAQVVGHGAVRWLERPEREREELPNEVLKNMELKPTDVVADIGAGSGYFTFRIAPHVPQGKALAVDIQQEMLDYIEGKKKENGHANVETILGQIDDTKLPAGTVDAVLMVDAYHEFSHPWEMMTSIVKGLKPGGRVIQIEYRGEDPKVAIKPLHKMTVRQCIKEMAAVGLEHVETRDFLPSQHFMIFRKPAATSGQ